MADPEKAFGSEENPLMRLRGVEMSSFARGAQGNKDDLGANYRLKACVDTTMEVKR